MLNKLQDLYEIQHTGHRTMYSMEGLRGFAVFLVFLVHYITLSEPWISKSPALHNGASIVRSLGNVGVDLFFVLSGYLIYGMLLKKERPFLPYLRRRIERIYPTFLVVLAIYLILSLVFPSKSKLPGDAVDTAVYIAANLLLLPGMLDIDPIVTVAWSLSYEFFFYLTVPLLIFALRIRRWPSVARIAFFLAMAVLILIFPGAVGGHVRLAMFISGILVYEFTTHSSAPVHIDLLGLIGLAIGLATVVAQYSLRFSGQWKFAVLGASFFLLCWACFSKDGDTSRVFRWTPLRWLGNISYSYYLFHGLTLSAVFLFLPSLFAPTGQNELVFWLMLPASFFVTFVAASLLFLLVEKPMSLAVRP